MAKIVEIRGVPTELIQDKPKEEGECCPRCFCSDYHQEVIKEAGEVYRRCHNCKAVWPVAAKSHGPMRAGT